MFYNTILTVRPLVAARRGLLCCPLFILVVSCMDIHNIIHCLIVVSSRMNDVGSVILQVSPQIVVMAFTKLSKKTTKPPPSPRENNDLKMCQVITHS
jgi:hypothetical protein